MPGVGRAFETGGMTLLLLTMSLLAGIALVSTLPVAHAITCPTNTTSGAGVTLDVRVTGADGSCPSSYSNSPIIHYALSTGGTQNPYSIVLSNCVGDNCPPTEIIIQGWANNQVVCGGAQPACSSTGPWTFQLDATVQAGQSCDTAPVKIFGHKGQPIGIMEAGTGDVCSTTTTTTSTSSTTTSTTTTTTTRSTTTHDIPEFGGPSGGFGLLFAIAAGIPAIFLARRMTRPKAN